MSIGPDFLEWFCCEVQTASLDKLHRFVTKLAERAEVDHVIYHLPEASTPKKQTVNLMSYPKSWAEHYLSSGYHLVDPVASIHLFGILPVDWSTLPRNGERVRTLFFEAKEVGIGPNGMTIPLRGRHNEAAIFSFTSAQNERDWRQSLRTGLPYLHLAAHVLHQRVLELVNPTNEGEAPALSPRERDCLAYLAQGLRDAQIAEKLGISRRVVSAYVENLRYKLNAATRASAVAKALKLGIIAPDLRKDKMDFYIY